MARTIQLDQFHLTVGVPPDLADAAAVRRTLDDRAFQSALLRAVRRVVRGFPALSKVRLTLSR